MSTSAAHDPSRLGARSDHGHLRELLALADRGAHETGGAAESAVRSFQQQRGLRVDGLLGPSTHRALEEARWSLGDRVLQHHPSALQAGDDVFALQQRLLGMGFEVGRVDGIFGVRTAGGLGEFQRNVGLPADGTCGPATLKALSRVPQRASGGSPDVMRAEDQIRRAGPRLSGKVVALDAVPLVGLHPGRPGFAEAWEIVHDVVGRVEARLVSAGVRAVLATPPGAEHDEEHAAAVANDAGADLTVALSVDAWSHAEASGVASYYFGSEAHGTRSFTGERLAGLVHREVLARTRAVDLRVHPKSWDLLRRTRMPAVRVDLGYLTNVSDSRRLRRSSVRDAIADAVVVGIQRFYLAPEADPATGVLRFEELRRALRQPLPTP